MGLRPKDAKPFRLAVENMGVEEDYFEAIARPIDLGTVHDRLARGVHKKFGEYLWDLSLVWMNARV